jgi:hypothetical protein
MKAPNGDLPHVEGVEHRFVDAGGLRVHLAEAGDPANPRCCSCTAGPRTGTSGVASCRCWPTNFTS